MLLPIRFSCDTTGLKSSGVLMTALSAQAMIKSVVLILDFLDFTMIFFFSLSVSLIVSVLSLFLFSIIFVTSKLKKWAWASAQFLSVRTSGRSALPRTSPGLVQKNIYLNHINPSFAIDIKHQL